ncbi:MAG: glycosyltransferase involved in cell wall biosynthesis [Cryomorphaceae bacterium]|jgi:glycosyltransferase involved in cell wall biosynthesis
MADRLQRETRLGARGKFFIRDGEVISVNAVTYGPFPDPVPVNNTEFSRIVKAGFNAIRIYEEPSEELMAAAAAHGLMVFVGVHWQWTRVFRGVGCERFFVEAKMRLGDLLEKWGGHEALVGCYVANEIPSDIARWIGPVRVKKSLEELIDFCRELAPEVLIGYSNYPSSEYLEPGNADFTGFNIYLEDRGKFADYLPRLHHLAGDRPVLISEFGIDSKFHGVEKQAEVLKWARQEALDAGIAGTTIFAWSDRWRVGEREVDGWEFGLTDRSGREKFLLSEIGEVSRSEFSFPRISVIICVYNGADRVWRAIESLAASLVKYPHSDYEVIVVDDGSTDGTQELVKEYDFVKLICAEHGGLSKARNLGAEAATGEILAYTDDDCEVDPDWLYWIAKGYDEQDVDAMGGPNIPPVPLDEDEAVVAAAPGAPSHVMLSDRDAEHIPGCNLTVRRAAFEAIGGFNVVYQVAGDDVDFCWRLEKAGFKIGFHGAAFVWHRRRTSLYRYFRQQMGYGKAEALLMRDHPERFTRGHGANWKGCVYTGAALGAHDGSFIYHGSMGSGAYQQVVTTMMPRRMLDPMFHDWSARMKLTLAEWLQPKVRRWARWWYSREWSDRVEKSEKEIALFNQPQIENLDQQEATVDVASGSARLELLENLIDLGWTEDKSSQEWDLYLSNEKLQVAQEVIGDRHWRLKIRLSQALGSEQRKSSTLETIVSLAGRCQKMA